MCLEGLMHGRWLMDASCNWFEVLDVENPGIEIAIPADDVKGVVIQNMFTEPVAHFDAYLKFAALGVRFKLFRQANVALRVGGVFEHLGEFIPITLRGFDLGWILDGKKTRLLAIQLHLPGGPKGDHN